MSVLIKGMKMPDDCPVCPLAHWNKLDSFTGCELIKRYFDKADMETRGRPSFCPLIELPVQHGRLIDADALRQSIKESIDECHKWADEVEGGEMYARVSQSLGTFVECSLRIKAAPTIIEAEEVQDGTL